MICNKMLGKSHQIWRKTDKNSRTGEQIYGGVNIGTAQYKCPILLLHILLQTTSMPHQRQTDQLQEEKRNHCKPQKAQRNRNCHCGRPDLAPRRVKYVTLNTAARDTKMKGFVVGPVQLKLGNQQFKEKVYVAPIEDDMLLGLDFLRRHEIDIRIQVLRLVVGPEEIPMDFRLGPQHSRVARVYIQRQTVVPPNAIKRITGVIDQRMEVCMFEKSPELPAIAACTLHDGGRAIEVCVINPTDRHVY